jgi:hypothetical protein
MPSAMKPPQTGQLISFSFISDSCSH